VIMWEVYVASLSSISHGELVGGEPDGRPFPTSCPFNYAVLALACMASNPDDRPPMYQIYEVLTSLDVELTTGFYIDWSGTQRVCAACMHHSANLSCTGCQESYVRGCGIHTCSWSQWPHEHSMCHSCPSVQHVDSRHMWARGHATCRRSVTWPNQLQHQRPARESTADLPQPALRGLRPARGVGDVPELPMLQQELSCAPRGAIRAAGPSASTRPWTLLRPAVAAARAPAAFGSSPWASMPPAAPFARKARPGLNEQCSVRACVPRNDERTDLRRCYSYLRVAEEPNMTE
jgi:hypothetical protein